MRKSYKNDIFYVMFILFLISIPICYLLYKNSLQNNKPNPVINIANNVPTGFIPTNATYSSYGDPMSPPLRTEYATTVAVMPINVPTNIGAVNASYTQIGILTPTSQSGNGNILPLMGKPLLVNRNKFQYYTISNQNNSVKLPISVGGKSGLDEYGVDELYDGDTVYVEGYEDVFKVTKYDNGTLRYLPI